jgi:hypothetical protein
VLTSGAETSAPPPSLDADTDDVWAAIVAGYHAEVEPAERSWPAAEDLASQPDEPAPAPRIIGRATARPAPARPDPDPEPSLLDGLDTFGSSLPDELEEGYDPPAPPPLPRPSTPTVLGVAGIVLGLLVFLKPSLLPVLAESTVMLLGFTAVVAGFGTLVWRLRPGDDDDPDSDPDDGARV